jgi:hypothetical protein
MSEDACKVLSGEKVRCTAILAYTKALVLVKCSGSLQGKVEIINPHLQVKSRWRSWLDPHPAPHQNNHDASRNHSRQVTTRVITSIKNQSWSCGLWPMYSSRIHKSFNESRKPSFQTPIQSRPGAHPYPNAEKQILYHEGNHHVHPNPNLRVKSQAHKIYRSPARKQAARLSSRDYQKDC